PLPDFPTSFDILVPTTCCPVRSSTRVAEGRNLRMINLFGRLRPGVSLTQAGAEMSLLALREQRDHPESFPASAKSRISVVPIGQELNGTFRPTLRLLFGTVILILLITCANVGNLSLARLLRREREIVLRSALGASQGRLVRQVLTESVVLALIGGLGGLLFAVATTRPLVAFARRFTPLADQVGVNGRVLVFTLGVAVVAGLLFGLFPAAHAYRRDLAVLMRGGGGHATYSPGRQRLRSALVVLQVAVSFVLLIAAGLTTRSALRLQNVNGGFDAKNVTAMSLQLPIAKYPDVKKVIAFYNALMMRVDALPGVTSSTVSSSVPLLGDVQTPSFRIEGKNAAPGEEQRAAVRVASLGYLKTLGVPLLAGRWFLASDDEHAIPVVLINQAMAKRFWPGEDPVGKRIEIQRGTPTWSTILGVVGDVREKGLDTEAGEAIYQPFLQVGGVAMTLFVRTAARPTNLAPALRNAVRELDSEQSVSTSETLEELRSESTAPARLTATLLTLFGFLAFAVTVAGLNGVIAYSINERTQEIGIRAALGAERGALLAMVMRQGLLLVLLGLALGWFGAIGGRRLLASVLVGIQPSDPITFLLASVVLLACGAAACFVPARRAASIDPLLALRQ
ncbi:MAG TPA: ADOP family duplicated permease, partial [Thermoanaerobaculia bacterium]|nr:ADOP family duplicated permease [Thermoanaerobaculia bacterium]